MDIQQVMTLAATPAKATANRGSDAASPGGFARELARVAQAAMGGQAPGASGEAPGAASGSLPALDDAGLEALRQAFSGGDMSALRDWLADAGMAEPDAEALVADLKGLRQALEGGEATPLPVELDLAGRAKQNWPPADEAAGQPERDADGAADDWAALRERLALIDQAGRATEGERGEAAATPLIAPMLQLAGGDSGRDVDASRRGPGGPALPHAEASSRITLQGAILEAMQRGSQADGGTARPASADALVTAFGRQAEVATAMPPPSQGEAPRGNLLEGLSPLTGNATGGQPNGTQATGTPPTATATLSAPVGSPAWPQQLGQQLLRMSQGGGEQRLELQLHPAELGPLSVSLKLGEQGAQAQFLSAHAQVRQALEQALPQLREALAEQGIQLGEATVGDQRSGGDGRDAGDGESPLLAGSAAVEDGERGQGAGLDAASGREVRLDGRVDLYA